MEIHFLQPSERSILETNVKQYVRDVINSEMFWQDFCRNVRVTHLVASELNEKIPRHLNEHVPRQVRDYLNIKLDSMVSNEIMKSLPGIVANNYQMQKLFDEHAQEMKQEIKTIALKEVDKIVHEEEYHVINQRYFQAFDNKGEQHLSSFDRRGNNVLDELRRKYDRDMSRLQTDLNLMSDCEKRMREFEDQIWWLKTTIGALGTVILGGLMAAVASR